MALFGSSRDVSFLRHINRELMGNIISQQCSFYKLKTKETKTNIYGEASSGKYYIGPVLVNCLIERNPQENPTTEKGIDLNRDIEFRFLRDDLLEASKVFNQQYDQEGFYGANLLPEIGDIILYQEAYHEISNVINNQYFLGKNPDYPNESSENPNPLNPGLSDFGWNVSMICQTYIVPQDKTGIGPIRYV